MRGNKNAAGDHKDAVGVPKANRIVTYRTGLLGNFGIGKQHMALGIQDRKGNTSFFTPSGTMKDGKVMVSRGLPANATGIKIWKGVKKAK